MKKDVGFMCTAFRDGLEAVYGGRVLTPDFLPVLEAACDAGIGYFEIGGGARFKGLYAHCNEDAFEMMDACRQAVGPEAELQTVANGVGLVGDGSQPRDISTLHAELFAKHGVSAIRSYDPLNDVDNLIYSGQSIAQAGLKHQVCVSMMALPPGWEGPHDPTSYLEVLRRILDAGVPYDSVCFIDSTGTSLPSTVYTTVKAARELLPTGTAIHFHTHDTAGSAVAANIAALEADADTIDLSLSPVSGGASQPDLLVMWHNLQGTEFELDVDIHKVRDIEAFLSERLKTYQPVQGVVAPDPTTIWSCLPGGALAVEMLTEKGVLDKRAAVVSAMGQVIHDGGCAAAAGPVAEAYVDQALNNATFGPWKIIAESYGRLVLGYLGKTPLPPDEALVEQASRQLDLEPTDQHPLDLNDADPEKGVEAARRLLRQEELEETAESIFIAATCGDAGLAFLKGEGQISLSVGGADEDDKDGEGDELEVIPMITAAPSPASGRVTLTVNGQLYDVDLDGDRVTVQGKTYRVAMGEGETVAAPAAPDAPATPAAPAAPAPSAPVAEVPPTPAGAQTQVTAPMPGTVTTIAVQPGDEIAANETILMMEAMKMETPVSAPVDGKVSDVYVSIGDKVNTGDVLALIAS